MTRFARSFRSTRTAFATASPFAAAALVATAGFIAMAGPLAPIGSASAQNNMTIYRCVDAKGAITLQNDVPCPKGSQQTARKIDALQPLQTLPATAAPPLAAAAPAAAARPAPAMPQPADAEPIVRVAPQPLYACRTWDERDYLSDIAEPPSRCVPVDSVGIGGSLELAAGQTCEMRQDMCSQVSEEALCNTWKKRVDEAEFRWKFAGSRDDERKAEFERFANIYRNSTCIR